MSPDWGIELLHAQARDVRYDLVLVLLEEGGSSGGDVVARADARDEHA